MTYSTLLVETQDGVATITLNRPERLNAINTAMPLEIEDAVKSINAAHDAKVIVLKGAGKGFCGGYDLKEYAEAPGETPGSQEMPWDPTIDFEMMHANTNRFMSLWRSYIPTICQVHGAAVAGGSDIALCCDLIVMADNARIGYPPARVWGVPSTMMWVYRLGVERAKRMLFTGDLIDGTEAAAIGLVLKAVPEADLETEVAALCDRIKGIPRNQLMMNKFCINQACDNMGLASTQAFATFFDGVARHSPEGLWFRERAQEVGFKQAVAERDSGAPIAEAATRKPMSQD